METYENEDQISRLMPDLEKVVALDYFAVIVTVPGKKAISYRDFLHPCGNPGRPVCGSAHCTPIPYWSERLGKKRLHAFQLSERGGELFCADMGERMAIGGRAVTYLAGTIRI